MDHRVQLARLGDSSLTPVVVTGNRNVEAVGVLIGGLSAATGLLFLAHGRAREGYSILVATAIVGSVLTAVRVMASNGR